MACTWIQLPGGGVAHVNLGRRKRRELCSVCGQREHQVLCDGRDAGEKTTCDEPLCPGCALHAPGDKDYCPRHVHQARLQRKFPFIDARRP